MSAKASWQKSVAPSNCSKRCVGLALKIWRFYNFEYQRCKGLLRKLLSDSCEKQHGHLSQRRSAWSTLLNPLQGLRLRRQRLLPRCQLPSHRRNLAQGHRPRHLLQSYLHSVLRRRCLSALLPHSQAWRVHLVLEFQRVRLSREEVSKHR